MIFTIVTALLAASSAFAAPTTIEKRSVVAISSASISSFHPYTEFARAAYCPGTATWNCGAACQAVSNFQVMIGGGDGNAVPLYYVGYYPTDNSIVVAHEGTDPTQFLSLLTDANIFTKQPDPSLFPGLSSSVYVHGGFLDAHAASAKAVLAAVKSLMSSKGTNKVTLVGHSLGGALSLIESVYIKLNVPTAIIKVVTYGTPRVGNQAFADWVDAHVSDLTHITNWYDVIPIVPGRGLGFHHPHGEVHIYSDTEWDACSGQDNTDYHCSTGAVPNIFLGNVIDHLGPYDGVWIGTPFC